jgi:hypothetical protein
MLRVLQSSKRTCSISLLENVKENKIVITGLKLDPKKPSLESYDTVDKVLTELCFKFEQRDSLDDLNASSLDDIKMVSRHSCWWNLIRNSLGQSSQNVLKTTITSSSEMLVKGKTERAIIVAQEAMAKHQIALNLNQF